MSEKETVEVTVKIPKRLMDVLEQEDYFGWSKQDFFVVAVQRGIGCELSDMPFDEMKRLEAKYGDIDEVSYTTKKVCVAP
jgi:hypothetical protein